MYIYNVTINVDESIHKEWLSWIHKHIPEVIATGRFVSAKLAQVLVDEEMGGVTYSVQYRAKTRKDLDDYYQFDAERMQNSGKHFHGKFVAFRTELKIIKEFV
ncbi:MAG: hypothetical protein COB73_06010 [Flavobacteriaceae bacterium]|nr:MAG: hypothetical protein COB73_06010 [Flavobacteriaceae bacterium]